MATTDVLAQCHRLSPEDFEYFIADVWQERQGWDTEVTQQSGDMGVDIWGEPPGGGPLTVVQAKRYAPDNAVGSRELQQYTSLRQLDSRIEGVTVVTTSRFTNQALEVADRTDVKCINGRALAEIIERYQARDILDWYLDGGPQEGAR